MATAYVVSEHVMHEGSRVEGVFSTWESAKHYSEQKTSTIPAHIHDVTYVIEQFEIDKADE
jgi:hypothetical protein